MDTGLTIAGANAALAELAATYTYIQLHDGLPGSDGQSNVAVEDSRKEVTWSSPSNGEIESADQLEWVNVAATETYSHFSAWDAATGGACGFTGTITASAVTMGDTFRLAAGDLAASFPVAED